MIRSSKLEVLKILNLKPSAAPRLSRQSRLSEEMNLLEPHAEALSGRHESVPSRRQQCKRNEFQLVVSMPFKSKGQAKDSARAPIVVVRESHSRKTLHIDLSRSVCTGVVKKQGITVLPL